MKLQTKFIKDTNEQYSIREDGVVFIHYRMKRITNTRKDKIICNAVLTIRQGSCVDIFINNKVHRKSINTLLFETFNFKICNQCENRFTPGVSPIKCNECRRKNRLSASLKYTKKWTKANPDLVKINSAKITRELHKSYIGGILGLKVNELPDNIYEEYKKTLKFKRKIAKEHNINIQTLK